MLRAMIRLVAWASVVLHVAGQNVTLPEGGNARCPCGNVSDYQPHNVSGFSQDYGIGCHKHDLGTPACAGDNPPAWCNQAWCFVKRGCGLPFSIEKEDLFTNRILSYATCGYLSAASSVLIGSALQNSVINVVIMVNSGGWKGSYYDVTNKQPNGPTYAFWTKVFQMARVAKVNVVYQFQKGTGWPADSPYAPEVMRQFRQDLPATASLFTPCVYATGMGYVDICIGAFSITPDRRVMSTTIETHSVQSFLVVKVAEESSDAKFWASVTTVFQVFDYRLWIVIGCVTVFMSLLMAWHEHFDFDDDEFEMFKDLSWRDRIEVCLYHGFASLLSGGGNTFEPTNRASRIVSLGLSTFVLLVCASYTANLASTLVVGRTPPVTLSGIQDAITQQKRICIVESDMPTVRDVAGVPPSLYLETMKVGKTDVVTGLMAGECDCAIVEDEVLTQVQAKGGDFCQLTKVGEPVITVDQGAPVSERVFRTLELYAANLSDAGGWKSALTSYQPRSACAVKEDNGPDTTLTLEEFIGPLLLTVAFVILSFVTQFSHCAHMMVVKNVHRIPGKLGRVLNRRFPKKKEGEGAAPEEAKAAPTGTGSASTSAAEHVQIQRHEDKLVLRIPASALFKKDPTSPSHSAHTSERHSHGTPKHGHMIEIEVMDG